MQAPQPRRSRVQSMTDAGMQRVPPHPETPAPEQHLGQLLQAITAGDEAAMATLYDTTSALIYGLALRILGDPPAAEEVTLEVYLQVWKQAAQYDQQRGTLIAWLFTMTRSRAIDRRRWSTRYQQRERPIEVVAHFADAAPDPADMSATQQQHGLLQAALHSLPPEQREAIELAYFAGLSHREIAEVAGQPLGTVKTRIRLGMLHLREHLLPLVEDYV